MKTKIIKLLLIVLIVISICAPILEMAIYGYDDLTAFLSDVLRSGVVVILCSAVLYLYGTLEEKEK